jgi:hypothetical protein
MGQGKPDCETCAAIGDVRQDTEVGDLDRNGGFCLRTSAGRYGRAVLVGEPTGDKVVLAITIWERHDLVSCW